MRFTAVCVVVVVLVSGCSDDGSGGGRGGGSSSGEVGFLEGWQEMDPELVEGEYEGVAILVDEGERVVYFEDCDLAEEATSAGHEYGPADGEAGYASVCPSGG